MPNPTVKRTGRRPPTLPTTTLSNTLVTFFSSTKQREFDHILQIYYEVKKINIKKNQKEHCIEIYNK